jgi:1,2-diacylglycerol 3-beta-galactosyltransferase
MRDTIKEYNPDAVILTYPLYQPPLTALKTISNLSIPILTVITDLVSVHRLWFDSHVDTCIVPTTVSRQLALEYGLPADMIHLAGIPVHPDIAKEQRDPHQIRRELGWDPDLPTFLAIGSRRVSGLMDILHVFNHYGKPLQLVLSAGKDPELYAQMQANDWHVPVHIYEYVQNMPVFMRAADVIIGKAGGLTVTESLASGRPILLVDVLPGQELGNAGYVVQNQAGDLIENPIDMLETLHHWMKDERSLMRYRAEQARKLGKPQAAYEIADLAWSAAGVEQHPGGSLVQLRTNMIDLLDRNKILWQTSLKKIGKNSPKP